MLLGRGRAAACKLYETGWTKLCWLEAPIKEGTVVGTLGRHFGLWALNACRIAYVIEEEEPLLQRYGFAFGTLPAHVERGEERFTVEWHCADDSVFYEVFSCAHPVHPLAKAESPFVRLIQRQFAAASRRSIAAATKVEGTDKACRLFNGRYEIPLERVRRSVQSTDNRDRKENNDACRGFAAERDDEPPARGPR